MLILTVSCFSTLVVALRFRHQSAAGDTPGEVVKERGEGLYIVGLDMHVGYIYYFNGKMSFVHANYYRRDIGVMSEPLIGRNPLNDSRYRVVGRIFDQEMVRNWILNEAYSQ